MSERVQEFDLSLNLLRALLWRYDQAPNLRALLDKKQAWYDREYSQFWRDWLRGVFDLRTANDFGCAVWARILNVPLAAPLAPTDPNKPTWGFGTNYKNFGNGNFGRKNAFSSTLTLAQKRLILRLRYFQLTSRATVPEVNDFLARIFGDEGTVYVLDPQDMSAAVFVFDYQPSSDVDFLLDRFDLLPRPAGVGVRRLVITRPVFGFGPYNTNFNHATFSDR